MWKLYDDLYIGIPSGIRIAGCIVGEKWTCVSANGNVGIARTLGLPEIPEIFQAGFAGAYLRDTGNHMKWDSIARACIGVAAMNAWYNTKQRVEELEGDYAEALITGDTAYIGNYAGENTFPLPQSKDFDATEYKDLCKFDNVIISSDALIAGTLPKLLDIIGEKENVIIEGDAVPCSALFFSFGLPVTEIRGWFLEPGYSSADEPETSMQKFFINRETIRRIQKRI